MEGSHGKKPKDAARKPRAARRSAPRARRGGEEPRAVVTPVFGEAPLPPPLEPFALGVTYLAGFQHHHGMHPKVLARLEPGLVLTLVREPGNPHDRFAIAVYTPEGARLGYLPQGCNAPIACMIDGDVTVRAAIHEVHPEEQAWKRVSVLLWMMIPAPCPGPSEN
ncbi:MAG: HIRAN domain-containing protein [Candidatus Eisenbacteria bacterium]